MDGNGGLGPLEAHCRRHHFKGKADRRSRAQEREMVWQDGTKQQRFQKANRCYHGLRADAHREEDVGSSAQQLPGKSEEWDFPTETVKFGPEHIHIDSWIKKHTYDNFKETSESGMQYYLQVSE
nr:interferon-related developmental regulator 1 [Oryctolagus cuniculus]